jgi:hypothetical protein
MKLGLSYIIPLLCLFQSTYATNIGMFQLETVEGDENTIFDSLICYIIPCIDEQLGWKNIFAPVAIDPDAPPVPETVDPMITPAEEEAPILQQLQYLLNFLDGNQQQQQEDGGFRRYLRSNQQDIKN